MNLMGQSDAESVLYPGPLWSVVVPPCVVPSLSMFLCAADLEGSKVLDWDCMKTWHAGAPQSLSALWM